MGRTILQIPVNGVLRREAEEQAKAEGFSSLQEAVRIFLKKLAQGFIGVTFNDKESIQLSERAVKRYKKISEDFRKGKNVYIAKGVDDLMLQLHEH